MGRLKVVKIIQIIHVVRKTLQKDLINQKDKEKRKFLEIDLIGVLKILSN